MITARSPSNRCDPVFSAFFGEGTADGKSERLAAATLWRHLSHNTEPPPLTALDSDMRGWTGAVGYGRHRVRYDARRRIVGILGREYEVPGNGDTLLLLLEDRPDEERCRK